MGAYTSVAAIGLSLQELLNRRFDAAVAADSAAFSTTPKARLVRTENFERGTPGAEGTIDDGTISIYCYRVEINRTMRPPWAAVGSQTGSVHLPLDVHFLLTAFDKDAEAELRLIGFTLLAMEDTPSLTGPNLHPAGMWEPGESVQLINEDISTEDMLRTFDTLPGDFRLSLSYVARTVRVDSTPEPDHPEVLTAVRGLTATAVTP